MSEQPALDASSPVEMRVPEILHLLHAAYPDATCELNFTNALELLVATILSAQCTDVRVNMVTPALFAKYPTAQAFAEADTAELEEAIRSTGFYRNKAKNIQAACRRLVTEYGGQVPADMDQLLTLAGVARKTANVVLGNAFGIADGIVVDTHVQRLAGRLGLTDERNTDKIECQLIQLVPKEEWIDFAHLLIFHGRRVCSARKPNCGGCVTSHLCPSAQV